MKSALALLFSMIFCFNLSAQNKKQEREERIDQNNVPHEIKESLSAALKKATRKKFYRESDGEKWSIEAKLFIDGFLYSIEFREDYTLEDVEKKVDFRTLKKDIQYNINQELSGYKKFKIEKTQIQTSSPNLEDKEVIKRSIDGKTGLKTQYELEIAIKENKSWTNYEMLFDSDGILLSKREIVLRPSDFILY